MGMKNISATPIGREKSTRMLLVRLINDELLAIGKHLAAEQDEIDRVEDQRKKAASQFKAQTEAHRAQIRIHSMAIATGEERRRVECETVWDYTDGKVTVTRCDTGEVIEERALRDEEAQMEMGGE